MKTKFSILSLVSATGLVFMPSLLAMDPSNDDIGESDATNTCENGKGAAEEEEDG